MTRIELILSIFLFFFWFYNAFCLWRKKRLNRLCDNSRSEASNSGNNIAFVGPTGDGKTTTGAGICMYLIEYIIIECNNRMNDIRIQLKDINFNNVINMFCENLEKSNDLINSLNSTLEFYIKTEKSLIKFNHDYINLNFKKDLLKNYILYFFCINIRKKFIYSKGYFFDRVSCEISNLFDDSSVELRNVLEKYNFQLDLCNIIFNDEVSLNRGNALSSSIDIKKSGATEFYSLIRNMFQGLTFCINTKQVSDNQVRQERLLINSTFQIFDRKTNINSFKLIQILLDLSAIIFTNFICKLYLILRNIFHKKNNHIDYSSYMNTKNIFRSYEYFVYFMKAFLKAQSYIRVRLFKFYSSEDVGKRTAGTFDRITMYFPVYYCYGLVNTYEYYESCYPLFNKCRDESIINEISKGDINSRLDRIEKIFEKEDKDKQ